MTRRPLSARRPPEQPPIKLRLTFRIESNKWPKTIPAQPFGRWLGITYLAKPFAPLQYVNRLPVQSCSGHCRAQFARLWTFHRCQDSCQTREKMPKMRPPSLDYRLIDV